MELIYFKVKLEQVTSNLTEASVAMISETHSIERRQVGEIVLGGGIAGLTAYAAHAISSWLNKGRMVRHFYF